MRSRSTVQAVAGSLLFVCSSIATAQIAPSELSAPGFLGPNALSAVQQAIGSSVPLGDKSKPVTFNAQIGTIYEFLHKGQPVLVIDGTKPIDFGAGVVLPKNTLVLNSWIAIFSRTDVTMAASDFPNALGAQLAKFWPAKQLSLYANGFAVRAEPTGDLLDDVRSFLALDNLSGTTVLAFAKSSQRRTTGLMLFGTINQPFGMEMTLTDPEIAYTKKETHPNPTLSLKSDVVIYGHPYEFAVQGDNPKKPEIFELKTTSLNPQDLINIAKAFSKPIFDLAQASDPRFKFDLIPTFSLQPPTSTSPNFPTSDQKKVVVLAAKTDKPEWKIDGPAIKVRGKLQLDLVPAKQDIAITEVAISKSELSAAFDIPNFKLPNSDLSFGTASAALGAAAGTSSLRLHVESGQKCFTQKFTFTVDRSGIPKVDLNADQTLKAMTPDGFYDNLKGCADDATQMATWAFKTGETVFGFGKDKLLDGSARVFGAEPTAFAAKAMNYPTTMVGTALAKVVPDKDQLLSLGAKVYGTAKDGKLYNFAKGAGSSAADLVTWAGKNKVAANVVGNIISPVVSGTVEMNTVLTAAATAFPTQVGTIANVAGFAGGSVGGWLHSGGYSATQAGKMLTGAPLALTMEAGEYFDEDMVHMAREAGIDAEPAMRWLKNSGRRGANSAAVLFGRAFNGEPMYDAAMKVYGVGYEGAAEMSRIGKYTSTTLTHWLWKHDKSQKEIAVILRRGGYVENQVKNAFKEVFSESDSKAQDLWDHAVDVGGRVGGYLVGLGR